MVEIRTAQDESAGGRWKSRYLGALDAQERLERNAGNRIGELSALLARLGRAFPDEQALGKRIAALTEALKRRPLDPRLGRDVDAAQSAVLDAMEAGARERADLHAALEEAVARLEPLARDRGLRRRLKKFRAGLRGRGALPAPSALLRDLGEIEATILAGLDGSGTHAAEPTDLRASADVPVLTEPVAASPAPSLDWPAVREVLAGMVARVDLPPPMQDRLQRVLSSLEEDLDASRLLPVLEQVRDLFDVALVAMQEEFQGFLDEVDRRLDGLLVALGEVRDGEAEAQALENGIADSMEAGLAAMRRDAARATALDQLKSSIEGHLDSLVRSVTTFRSEGSALGEARDARLQALTRRLRELEGESQEARGQLEAQRRLALTDALTGLPNRRAVDEHLARCLERARRDGAPLAVAIADLDHFKHVNDAHGHQAGDRALAIFADIVRRRVRATDFFGRFGGEEFLLLFPDSDASAAARRVDEVRGFVAGCGFSHRGTPVPITASFGVTQARPDDDPGALLARADKALYAAKAAGRNRVEVR